MHKNLLVLGAGGHAKVVADCAFATGQWNKISFLDDRFPKLTMLNNWEVIGKISELSKFLTVYPELALGVGSNSLRLDWLQFGLSEGFHFPVIIHPSAVISSFADIDKGSVVFAGAVLNIHAKLGAACIINTGANVDHDCTLADGVHISPGASLAGEVIVGKEAWVCMGAQITQGRNIGKSAIVGAGAVVLNDVGAHSTVVGVPASPVN